MEEEGLSTGRGFDPTPLLRHLLHRTTMSGNRLSLLVGASRRQPTTAMDPSSSSSDRSPEQFDERQGEWGGYSKPVVVLDVIWNLAFVLVSVVVLLSTLRERPSTPLRVWIGGYALQCVVHVGLVCLEYRMRRRSFAVCDDDDDEDDDERDEENQFPFRSSSDGLGSRVAKRLESMNTMGSFFWWVMGFYWIVVGGQTLLQDAPRLYWLAVVFLAFDVFFAIFCVMLACIIGIALCCCLPCIIAVLYSVAVREGASEDDIKVLPRYKFRRASQLWPSQLDKKREAAMQMRENSKSESNEISLPSEDSECCICLSQYVDGVELQSLPCNHLFHSRCITKWLRINATCPLCKYNILNGDELV